MEDKTRRLKDEEILAIAEGVKFAIIKLSSPEHLVEMITEGGTPLEKQVAFAEEVMALGGFTRKEAEKIAEKHGASTEDALHLLIAPWAMDIISECIKIEGVEHVTKDRRAN